MREEFERIYSTVRQAFTNYDLDAARPYLTVPEGTPEPSREECTAMAQFLPGIEDCRFIVLRDEEDRAAYYMESDLANDAATEVTVLRFVRTDGAWKLAQGPHTMSSYNTEGQRDEAGLLAFIEEQESLAPFPEGME